MLHPPQHLQTIFFLLSPLLYFGVVGGSLDAVEA